MWKYSNSINDLLISLTKEEIQEKNIEEEIRTKKEYDEFVEYYRKWECNICKKSLNIFSSQEPCLHYLLRRNSNFKKKNFKDIYKEWWYFNISSYLRWVANQERFIWNINNLESEKWKCKKFEYTIKWKNIEWTFSCAESDFIWHRWTNSDFPHYHFQMRIDSRPFIDFSQYHISFSEIDLFNFDFIDNNKTRHWWWNGGVWIQELFDDLEKLPEEDLDEFLTNMQYTNNEEDAQTNISTFMEWQINWNEFSELLKERDRTWKTMNTLLKEKYPHHKIQTIVSPIDSIPNVANREERRWR